MYREELDQLRLKAQQEAGEVRRRQAEQQEKEKEEEQSREKNTYPK